MWLSFFICVACLVRVSRSQYVRSLDGGCDPSWIGVHCNRRICPYGIAWNAGEEGSVRPDTGYAECSNGGYCDRRSGECICFKGYTGGACQRNFCPKDCSGRGKCVELDEINFDNLNVRISNKNLLTKNMYKYAKARSCNCDPGWGGPSCEERLCPRGDDPRTSNTEGSSPLMSTIHEADEIQTVTVGEEGGSLFGTFRLEYTSLRKVAYATKPLQVPTTVFSDGISFSGSTVTDYWRRLGVFQEGDHVSFENTESNDAKSCLVKSQTAASLTCESTTSFVTEANNLPRPTLQQTATFADLGTKHYPQYTITDSNASLSFAVDDIITVRGSHRNDGQHTVSGVSSEAITVHSKLVFEKTFYTADEANKIVFNSSDSSVTDTSAAGRGQLGIFSPGDILVVSGSNSNNGMFVVSSTPHLPSSNKFYLTTNPVNETAPVNTTLGRNVEVFKEKRIKLVRRLGRSVAYPAKVKWELQSLPEHILPVVNVSLGTHTPNKLAYVVTYVHEANTGNQNELKCFTKGCDLTGCSPRHEGLFHVKTIVSVHETDGSATFSIAASSNTISIGTAAQSYVNFITLGYRKGAVFQVAGTASNDGEYVVKSFSKYSIEVETGGSLVDEASPALGAEVSIHMPSDSCAVTETFRGTHEDTVCSGRGLCDRKYGNCECIAGFTGTACSQFYKDMP